MNTSHTYNPERSFVVSGITRWQLCKHLAQIPGVVFIPRPSLIGSSARSIAEFTFREIQFQVDDGGDTGGDGLWIAPTDGSAHPAELREIREHLNHALSRR